MRWGIKSALRSVNPILIPMFFAQTNTLQFIAKAVGSHTIVVQAIPAVPLLFFIGRHALKSQRNSKGVHLAATPISRPHQRRMACFSGFEYSAGVSDWNSRLACWKRRNFEDAAPCLLRRGIENIRRGCRERIRKRDRCASPIELRRFANAARRI